MNFMGKTIVVTGASKGIGLSIAEKLFKNFVIKNQCKLVLISRKINSSSSKFSKTNNLMLINCDVSNLEEVRKAKSEIIETFGAPNVYILNAGIANKQLKSFYTAEESQRIVDTNLFGVINFVSVFYQEIIKTKDVIIAATSSLADVRALSRSSIYSASKAALTIYLEGLSLELKSKGVKIITIRPGFVETEMTKINEFKMPFLMSSSDAADKILKGIQKEKRYIQFPFAIYILSRLLFFIPNKVFEFIFASKQ